MPVPQNSAFAAKLPAAPETFELRGKRGTVVVHHWPRAQPRFVVLIAHGFGEHAGRYATLAERLGADAAEVYAPDHFGEVRVRDVVDDGRRQR